LQSFRSFEFQRKFFITYSFVRVKKLPKSLLFHIICISVPSETKHCETNYNGLTLFRVYFLIVINVMWYIYWCHFLFNTNRLSNECFYEYYIKILFGKYFVFY